MDVIYPSQAIQTEIHIIIFVIASLVVLIGIYFIKKRPTLPSQAAYDNLDKTVIIEN